MTTIEVSNGGRRAAQDRCHMRSKLSTRCFFVAIVFCAFKVTAGSTDFIQQARLSSEVAGQSYANNGVGISGDTAVVASSDGYLVYVRSGQIWTQQTNLVPSDGMAGCGLPRSVAIDGDTVVVGCASQLVSSVNLGAAYVFVRSGSSWSQQQRLIAVDGESGDGFGRIVSLKGDVIAVASPLNRIGTNANQGSVYIFSRSNDSWTEQANLSVNDAAPNQYLGRNALSIDTNQVAVSGGGLAPRSVYIFTTSGAAWTQQERISNCEPSGSNGTQCWFGRSLSLAGDKLFIGNHFLNVGANQIQGGVYFYVRSSSNWTQQQRITAADGLSNDLFGSSLSVNLDTLIVGAPADIGFPGKADIYEFDGGQWTFHQRLSTGTNRNAFGEIVSFDGTSAIIATPQDASGTSGPIGAAYVFARPVITPVSISGRVVSPTGQGVRSATIILIDSQGSTRRFTTGTFGYFSFSDVPQGSTTINVASRRYRFSPQSFNLTADLTDLSFIAME